MPNSKTKARVVVSKNGPYLVTGELPIAEQIIGTDAEGSSESWKQGKSYKTQESCALCRCGQSSNKPFCDGTHSRVGFDGTETASRALYEEQATVQEGPSNLALMDAENLCAFARFCDPHGQVWNQIEHTDEPEVRKTFLRQVGNCPSGRLVAWDMEAGKSLEPVLPLSIGLVEDPAQECSGPIWLRGGVELVSADGFAHETRNRVTLCRCGASQNKPFCDGTHASIKFNAR
jgi:CDGSH-type Zn-finger protein